MVSKEFVELSEKLIKAYADLKIEVGNGNVIIAKPPVEEKTRGGIIVADMARELESKRAGFAKVIAIPNNLEPDNGDIGIKPGDYIWFTYVADNPLYVKALSNLTGITIPPETVYFTGDNEIIQRIAKEQVEK